MLHQSADQFQPSTPAVAFDAAAYVRDMRAANVELVEIDDGFCLKPVGGGFTLAYAEAEARWHGLVDEDAQRSIAGFLIDERGAAEAHALIGDDLVKGLAETRRLQLEARRAYAIESSIMEAISARGGDQENDAELKAALKVGDRACHQHHYAVMHVAALPGRTLTELAAKAQFALEHRDYTTDEDFVGDVLKEIVGFVAPDMAARS